jgi:hypothetical protein
MKKDSKIPSIKLIGPNSGPIEGGTKVEIEVEGLDGFDLQTMLFTTVRFDDIDAPEPHEVDDPNDDTQIVKKFTVTSPPGAGVGKVDITLITPGGTVITSKAVVSSVQPHPDLVPVIIKGHHFTGAKAVKFGQVPAYYFEAKSESEIWALAAGWTTSDPVLVEMPGPAEEDTTFNYYDPAQPETAPPSTGRRASAGARSKEDVVKSRKQIKPPTNQGRSKTK